MSDTIILCIITAASSLLGITIGVLSTAYAAARRDRIEERKHFRELGLKVAVTKYEGCARLAQQLADATGKAQATPNFESFVVEGVKFMDILSTPGLSAQEMARRMAELRDFTHTICESTNHKGKDKA